MTDWNKELDIIINSVRAFETLSNMDDLKKSIRDHSASLHHYIKYFADINIAPKYRRKVVEDMEEIVNLRSKLYDNGYDLDNDNIDLQRKIQENSIDPFDKQQADKFGRLKTMVNIAKGLKNSNNVDGEKLAKQIENINDYADKYVERFIQPDKREYMKSNVTDWLNKELVSNKTQVKQDTIREKIDLAQKKFEEDYRKYYILNNATTILDEYLILAAKDAPEDKDNKKDVYKTYLENAINLSKFVEVQDILIEAERTGNPAQVKDYFKEYDVINNLAVESMNSDTSIDYMVRSLLMDDNTKTAKMLVEKLGLGDRVMKIEQSVFKANNPKQYVDETVKLLTETKEFTDIVNAEIDKLKAGIDSTDDLNKLFLQTKRNLVQNTKSYTEKDKRMKKDVQEFIKAINETKKLINEHPDMPKNILVDQCFDSAYNDRKDAVNRELKDKQEYIQASFLVYRFLTSLHLPEGSKGEKIRQQMEKDYEELKEYSSTSIAGATVGMNVEFVNA